MKPITRNLFTYQADILADAAELDRRLPHFDTIGAHQNTSWGFTPVVPNCEARVLSFAGGWALCFRLDSKILPGSTVRKAVDERAKEVQGATGRKPGKLERREIKADVMYALLAQAFVRTQLTYVAYSARSNRLFINTSSQKTADTLMSAMVYALESVKTSTVHVSEPKLGLTQRLVNWLDDADEDECFGSFHPSTEIVMGSGNRKWSVKLDRLKEAEPTLRNAIASGAKVDSMRFDSEDGVGFRIDQALRLKGVQHLRAPDEDDESDDIANQWNAQFTLEVATLDAIMDELLHLLRPEKAQATKGDGDLFSAD